MKSAVFVRYETILTEPSRSDDARKPKAFGFAPGVITALCSIAQNTDCELIMLADLNALEDSPYARQAIETLAQEGVHFASTQSNDSLRNAGFQSKTGLPDVSLAGSLLISSSLEDVTLTERLGLRTILLTNDTCNEALLTASSWSTIADFVISQARYGECSRTTKETSITTQVALYGMGTCSIETGLGFFDHMLTLLGSHAGCNLTIRASGDLWVDEHHLIEDVGIVLGDAISRALGDRRGISRYGFLLPMDEALAQVALDLAARSHLEWSASFTREKVGDMPTEMFKHFFKSLAESLRCSLHISVSGENEHHKIEAIFKGVGRALRMAINRDRLSKGIPSTKGVL